MRRRLFTLASILSLAVFATAAAIWSRSYGGTPAIPSTARMQASLARPLPQLDFNSVGLVDVLDFLHDVSGTNIDVDWRGLAARNIDRNAPITLHLNNVRFGDTLAKVMAAAGPFPYVTEDDVIHISTQDLRAIQRPPRPGTAGDAMRKPISLIQFDEVPLNDALNTFSLLAGEQVALDWPVLEQSGVKRDARVSLRMRSAPADAVLAILLRDVRGNEDLQFQARGPAVVISTQHQFELTDRNSRWPLVVMLTCSAVVLLAMFLALWRRQTRGSSPSGDVRWTALWILLLVAAAAGLLAWSFNPPVYEHVLRDRRFTLGAERGLLRLWSTPADPATVYQDGTAPGTAAAPDAEKRFEHLGFSVRGGGAPFRSWVFAVPLWELAALAALLPLLWVRSSMREFRRRRVRRGLCTSCGYNLTGNTSGICPECGTLIPEKAEAVA